MSSEQTSSDVAVIGMAGRFPGARSVEELWANLCAGLESIRFFSDDELLAAGVPPAQLADPSYVKARGVLDDVDLFDAPLFGFTPRDAEISDPQQRLFLECAWEALESAGYDPSRFRGRIGVFAGANFSGYLHQLLSHGAPPPASDFELEIGNDKDYLATRVSYKLDLRGPSITVQTTCSTSLVATHLAVQSLLSYECDIALAGGVSITRNQISGDLYLEGGVLSPDGHCRAFDARAQGTVNGNGLGIVVLRRLDDALVAGDPVRAVLRGSAVNNDGAAKVGFTAPSIAGQAQVIAEALAMAGIDPSEISYVEAHGTGTALGDPVEVAALRRAFGDCCRQTCRLGTIKSNIGHLSSAAGVAGLIKTVLMLENRKLVPSLHFESPNPQIDFANSPFRVCTQYSDWTSRDGMPRRAGVSSFGLGGTNAHVVLEEAPALPPRAVAAGPELFVLSARTPGSLEKMTQSLARDLERRPALDLGDVAYTLQIGRRQLAWRRAVVASTGEEAAGRLADLAGGAARHWDGRRRSVAFLFPGQGSQVVGMGAALARAHLSFCADVDRCAGILHPLLGRDLRELLFAAGAEREEASRLLGETCWAQPALFVVEYALARLWMRWGVEPRALLGHSVGELVAACLSGVFELPEALTLIASRGRLLQALPRGAMLSVALPREEVEPLLGDTLSIAAVNGPAATVVAGAADAIERLRRALESRDVGCRLLQVGHAFHSTLVQPAVEPWVEEVARVACQAPRIPIVSNVTGAFLTPGEAMDPGYWGRHLREAVRFSAGLETLFADPEICLLEVGPGETLARLSRRHPGCGSGRAVVSSLAGSQEEEDAALLSAVGRLWCEGVEVDWEAFSGGKGGRRVSLPTYPFERQRYWLGGAGGPATRRDDRSTGFFLPVWKSSPSPSPFARVVKPPSARSGWLVFSSGDSLSTGLVACLEAAGEEIVVVTAGDRLIRLGDRRYGLRCDVPSDYEDLFRELRRDGRTLGCILHLWCAASEEAPPSELLARGFGSLVALARAIESHGGREPIRLTVVSSAMQKIAGETDLCAEKATLLGPCRAMSRELPQVSCRSVDVQLPPPGSWQEARLMDSLLAEAAAGAGDAVVAYRGLTRWVLNLEPVAIPEKGSGPIRLHERGVYLITGATSAAGLAAARFLAGTVRARLVLAGTREIVSSPVLRELEQAGAEVMTAGLEPGDGEGLRTVLAAARKRFGAVQGAIYAEEGPGDGPLRLLDPERAVRALAARIAGVRHLDELLREDRPGFVVLVGSARSIVARGGLAEQGAGDAFLDAFASREATQREMPVLALHWSDHLSAREGAGLFGRALSSTVPQLVAARADLREPEEPGADEDAAASGPALHGRPDLDVAYVAPRDEMERELADLWQEIFRMDGVGVHDNFFALGGDSLVGVQMSARALRRGLRFSPRQLFELPTIAELALHTEVARDQPAVVDAAPFSLAGLERASLDELLGNGVEIEDAYPLSPLQQGLLFHSLFDPGSGDYLIQVECDLHGELRPDALRAAWERVVGRFAVLRTSFLWKGLPEPLQIVHRGACLVWEEWDWRGLEEREIREKKDILLRTDRARGFDLSQAPLTRFALLRTGDDSCRFLWTFHHVLFDAWSEALVLSEVFAAYREIVQETEPVAVRPAAPFSRYIAWLRRQDLGRAEAFWRESLRGLTNTTLLPARAGGGAGCTGYEKLERRLDAEPAELVQAFLRGRHLTLNTLAQGALALLLGHLSGRPEVVFGLTVSGRPPELADVESIAGLFINTLPLRVRLPEETSAVEWLEDLQDRLIEIQRYGYSPLVEIQKWSELPKGVALFEVISTFENAPRSPMPSLADLGLEIRDSLHAAQNSNPLTVLVVPSPEIQVGMLFDRHRFGAADVEKWLDSYTSLLRGLAERPEAPLGAFLADLDTAARIERQMDARGFAEASRQRLRERIRRLGGIARGEDPEIRP